jgi:catechol 2,3-dioxygenase-like lactoylglutathione lyase family enzyme
MAGDEFGDRRPSNPQNDRSPITKHFDIPRAETETQMSDTQTALNVTQVGTVIVPVSDQDAALDFYVGKLGFEKRADIPFGNGDRWVEVAPAGAATTIAIVKPPEGRPTGGAETGIALSTTDVDADHAALKAAGVDVDEEVMRMGDPVPPMFFFRDQDGNKLLDVQSS